MTGGVPRGLGPQAAGRGRGVGLSSSSAVPRLESPMLVVIMRLLLPQQGGWYRFSESKT